VGRLNGDKGNGVAMVEGFPIEAKKTHNGMWYAVCPYCKCNVMLTQGFHGIIMKLHKSADNKFSNCRGSRCEIETGYKNEQ
jgi:hypothetical protein